MGKLENKRDLSPYRNLKSRIDNITQDGRYAFMFGSLTVYDGMTQVLSRIFRVPVGGKPITILELTGIPTEIVNVVVSVLCRMTFDFVLWSEGQVPVTLVCEEAHRYVPANPDLGFEPCKRAIAKIAKEGRKYGASLCIVTQRPAEIDPTILSQCNTVFALRMSNDRDQEIVTSAISDTGSGLLEFLSALGQREAIAFGDGVTLPVRIKFDELPKSSMPRSSTAKFSDRWQNSVGDEGFLEHVVERWRSSGGSDEDNSNVSMMADALLGPSNGPTLASKVDPLDDFDLDMRPASAPPAPMTSAGRDQHAGHHAAMRPREPSPLRSGQSNDTYATRHPSTQGQPPVSRQGSMLRRDTPRQSGFASRGEDLAPAGGGVSEAVEPASQSLKSLRDRLMQRPR